MPSTNLAPPICDKPMCLLEREAALLGRNLIAGFAGLLLVTSWALAQSADDDGKPNALSTLLPHQKDRVFCYASSGAPVTYPLEDLPKRKKPRTAAASSATAASCTSNRLPARIRCRCASRTPRGASA